MNTNAPFNEANPDPSADERGINDMVREFVDDIAHLEAEEKKRPAKSYLKKPAAPKKTPAPKYARKPAPHPSIAPQPVAAPTPAPKAAPVTNYSDDNELPQKYNATYVRLLPRDPYHIYAYWEIDATAIEKLREQLKERFGEAAYTLRVYDVTLVNFNGTNANYHFDLDELFMNCRHIRVANDNADYCVETGVRLWDGTFVAIARSNTVRTQPANPSGRGDLMWKEIQIQKQQQAFALINAQRDKIKQQRHTNNNLQFNLTKIPISGEDIRLFYEKGMSLKSIIENNLRAAGQGLDDIRAEDIELEDIIVNESHGKMTSYKSKFLGASEELVKEFVGASEGMFFREVSKRKQKTFPFQIEMELIVRGKTKPDAKVMLGSEPVPLDKDGTFTLKYVLNDGLLPFDFKATSADGDIQKKISTSVLRTQTQTKQDHKG